MNKYLENAKKYWGSMSADRKIKIEEFLVKAVELIITGIVFAVIASLLTTAIIEKRDAEQKISDQLDNLSNVYIGCNKQWADEAFGAPQFTGQKDEYLLCAYISDYYVLQMVFDEAQAAQAYLITALDNSEGVDILITDTTLHNSESFVLGDISFYDFRGIPMAVFGFVSQGTARALYSEVYNFTSFGNYYNYYIASFDYGKTPGDIEAFLASFSKPENDIDDEVTAEHNCGVQIITDRRNNCPNTYGVAITGLDLFDVLCSYDWFNSMQLLNKLNSEP